MSRQFDVNRVDSMTVWAVRQQLAPGYEPRYRDADVVATRAEINEAGLTASSSDAELLAAVSYRVTLWCGHCGDEVAAVAICGDDDCEMCIDCLRAAVAAIERAT